MTFSRAILAVFIALALSLAFTASASAHGGMLSPKDQCHKSKADGNIHTHKEGTTEVSYICLRRKGKPTVYVMEKIKEVEVVKWKTKTVEKPTIIYARHLPQKCKKLHQELLVSFGKVFAGETRRIAQEIVKQKCL